MTTKTNLTMASNQWASRPAEQRYWTVDDLMMATERRRASSREVEADPESIRFMPASVDNGDSIRDHVRMTYGDRSAVLSSWAVDQAARRAGFARDSLAKLPVGLASEVLNHTWTPPFGNANLLIGSNGTDTVRALMTDRYQRIWDTEIVQACQSLVMSGWRVPPARPAFDDPRARIATEADILRGKRLGMSINVGDMIAPAGVYGSDRDVFVFLVDDRNVIDVDGGAATRCLIAWNSEVGAKPIGLLLCLCEAVCGNHIIWGAQSVVNFSKRHVGDALRSDFRAELDTVARLALTDTLSDDAARIKVAKADILGANVIETVEESQRRTRGRIPLKALRSAYETAVEYEAIHGNPNSVWAMYSGLTRDSQSASYADARIGLDIRASQLLQTSVN